MYAIRSYYAAQDIIIEAEDFNATGGTYEDSNVGFAVKADGTYMSWVNKGDWSEYTFTVPKAGSYDISYFISSPHSNSQIFLLVDDQAIANDEVPNNGDWFDFQKLESQSKVSLSAGEHMKITIPHMGNIYIFMKTPQSRVALYPTSGFYRKCR